MSKKKKGNWKKKTSIWTKLAGKSLNKSGKYALKTRNKASDWIVRNINPDIYNTDADFDIDPWNPYGTSRKKKKRR